MDATDVTLLLASIESVKTDVKGEIKNLKNDVIVPLKKDVDDVDERLTMLERWKWKVVGIVIGSGGAGFLTGSALDFFTKGK